MTPAQETTNILTVLGIDGSKGELASNSPILPLHK